MFANTVKYIKIILPLPFYELNIQDVSIPIHELTFLLHQYLAQKLKQNMIKFEQPC